MVEFRDIYAMLDDIVKFARKHTEHEFLWNDRMGPTCSLGIVAYRPHSEDEQIEEWTIPVVAVKSTVIQTDARWVLLSQALKTSAGKQNLLKELVAYARRPVPPGEGPERRTRWEQLLEGLDED